MRAISFALLFASLLNAQPVPVPKLFDRCQFGDVVQTGKAIEIRGEAWSAIGQFRDDGRIFLLWTSPSTGEPCPGVYEWIGGELVGHWGTTDTAWLDKNGSLVGEVRAEKLYGAVKMRVD